MLCVIASEDKYLGKNIGRIVAESGHRNVRSKDIERIITELKSPGRLIVADMAWEGLHERGLLRRLVNLGMISGNIVVAICPNQDEKIKKLAKAAGCKEIFIRYDLETRFREFCASLIGG